MADVLLTHGYFLYEDEKELQIMKPYPTLGLLYLSSYLKQQGFGVDLFDSTFRQRDELWKRLEQGDSGTGGVLGVYTNLMTRKNVVDIVRKARQYDWTVVLGGPESANYPREFLERGAHVVVVGEGEVTLAELLPELAERGPHRLHDVAGTVFLDEDGELVRTEARAQVADLDSLPWPDRESIDQTRYVDVWREHHNMGSVNLITARGCAYKCRWCSHAVFGHSHRRRSAEDCADEVLHLKERYQPDQVWYADDVFTIHHRWLFNFHEQLKKRDVHMPFETISRADRMMKDEVLETLAAMGCYRVWIGSESGSQRILDRMQRQVTVEQVQWATQAAQRHGIQVGMFLMWGYDGETVDDIAATIDHVKKANPDIYFTTVAYPIMGTRYFEDVKEQVVAPKDWENATDRDVKIRGRHSRAYYKAADRWLRGEVDAFRLKDTDPEEAAQRLAAAQTARGEMRGLHRDVEA